MWQSLPCCVARCNKAPLLQHHETKEAVQETVTRGVCFVSECTWRLIGNIRIGECIILKSFLSIVFQHPSLCPGPVWPHVKFGPRQTLYSWTSAGQRVPEGRGPRQDAPAWVCQASCCTNMLIIQFNTKITMFTVSVSPVFRCGRTVTSCGVRNAGVRSRRQRKRSSRRPPVRSWATTTAAATLRRASPLLGALKLQMQLLRHCSVS